MAGHVHREHAPALGKRRHDLFVLESRSAVAVEQDERGAAASFEVVDAALGRVCETVFHGVLLMKIKMDSRLRENDVKGVIPDVSAAADAIRDPF
jgi:hypothetical protein